MILGRSPNLVIGAATAIYGVVSVFHLGGFSPTPEQTGVVVTAIGAVVALIANSAGIQIAAGEAAKDRASK